MIEGHPNSFRFIFNVSIVSTWGMSVEGRRDKMRNFQL